MPKRPCLKCGRLSSDSYCPAHKPKSTRPYRYRAEYGGDWRRKSRRAIAEWVATNGWVCPGWRRAPHASRDLCTDHDLGIMCRQCNGVKGATVDKERARQQRGEQVAPH